MKVLLGVVISAAFLLLPVGVLTESEMDDTTPPELVEFSFDPTEVDVTAGPAEVAVTARLTDDLSGVEGVYFSFDGPSGQSFFVFLYLESGTPNDGSYQGTAIFEQYSEEGIWQVDRMQLFDVVGNAVTLQTSELQGMGFPTDISVISSTSTERTSWGRLKVIYENQSE